MEPLDQKIGKYTLVYKIGDGGMAEVFKARVRGEGILGSFEKEVALKKILPNLASNEKFRRNFINEAQICGKLHHHNIVEVYDFAQDGNDLYLAMEYIDGLNLEEVFNYHRQIEQPMTTDVVLAVMVQVLEGLEYAHHAKDPISHDPLNVIHRDLKPSNILIDNAGVVKIVDFGVAKAANRRYETQEMTAKGTASYMAPEQLLGDRPVTPASDLFSVGTIFFELLTLERLFDGEHVFAILKQVATLDIDGHLDETLTGGDRRFLPVLRKAMAREPEERYKRAGEMLRDLLGLHIPGATPRRLADHLRKIRNLAESMEDAATRLVTTRDNREIFNDEDDEDEEEAMETRVVGSVRARPAPVASETTEPTAQERPTSGSGPRAVSPPRAPEVTQPTVRGQGGAMPSIMQNETTQPTPRAVQGSPGMPSILMGGAAANPANHSEPTQPTTPLPVRPNPPNPHEEHTERTVPAPTFNVRIGPIQDAPSFFGPIALGAVVGMVILVMVFLLSRG